MTEDVDVAWAAGLFEGEGSFTWHTKGRPSMIMRMTDEDEVRGFAEVVGEGKVYGPYMHSRNPEGKPFWQWQVTGKKKVERVGRMLAPYLGERRSARLGEILGYPVGMLLVPPGITVEKARNVVAYLERFEKKKPTT